MICPKLSILLISCFEVLKLRLINSGLSEQAVAWFSNYLSDRSQCIRCDGLCSNTVAVTKGVPQGSVLGPLLFTIYINNMGQKVLNANLHFYADDTVIYCSAPTLVQAIEHLQKAFIEVQNTLMQLKLVLNGEKTKLKLFTKSRTMPQSLPPIVTMRGSEMEVVNSYLFFFIDDSLTFKPHVLYMVKKLRLKLGFYFRNKLCFCKKATCGHHFFYLFWTMVIFYMHTSAQNFHMIDTAYHASLRFITNCKALTRHCELYSRVGWPPLATRRLCHWYTFIYKAILGLLPSYLCVYIIQKRNGQHFLRSQDFFMLSVPKTRTEMGKKAFLYSAPSAWNTLQKGLES